MCCLYYIDEAVERDIERLVNDIDKNIKLKTGDIHPTDQAPVICKRNQDLYATSMKWGFMGRDQKPLINARAESALEKPTFSDSVMHRRCIIPAGKFYEWNRDKQKAAFRYRESPSIYMAGFYRRFVILTTVANASMRSVHDRMPLILGEKDIRLWIYEDAKTDVFLKKASPMLERQQEYEQMSLF